MVRRRLAELTGRPVALARTWRLGTSTLSASGAWAVRLDMMKLRLSSEVRPRFAVACARTIASLVCCMAKSAACVVAAGV